MFFHALNPSKSKHFRLIFDGQNNVGKYTPVENQRLELWKKNSPKNHNRNVIFQSRPPSPQWCKTHGCFLLYRPGLFHTHRNTGFIWVYNDKYYRDSYQPTSEMECNKGFNRCSHVFCTLQVVTSAERRVFGSEMGRVVEGFQPTPGGKSCISWEYA